MTISQLLTVLCAVMTVLLRWTYGLVRRNNGGGGADARSCSHPAVVPQSKFPAFRPPLNLVSQVTCWSQQLQQRQGLTKSALVIFGLILLSACGGDDSASSSAGAPSGGNPASYLIGGTVSGLAGPGLVLQNNGGDDLSVTADGAFKFATSLLTGKAYSVTIKTQPTNPAQVCAVSGASGTVASTDVTTVAVSCTTSTFTVGGMVSGLSGSGLVLQNNGTDDLSVAAGGAFTFATKVAAGSAYDVTVETQPTSPAQQCTVTNPAGTIAAANIASITITCATSTHSVGGTVTGLTGSGLVLQDNGHDDLTVSASGNFHFATALSAGATYAVTIKTQPANPAQACTLSHATGTVADADVTNVAVACAASTPVAAVTSPGTPISDPTGNPMMTTTAIGPAGGTLSAPDGQLSVMIPAGALSSTVNLTATLITSTAPGGLRAYRLGPEGQTFQKPVKLAFSYADADLRGTVSDSLGVGYQLGNGTWGGYKQVVLDTTAKTVSVTSQHFSDWSALLGTQLSPGEATISPGHTLTLTVVECTQTTTDDDDQLVSILGLCVSDELDALANWSVNGVVGGGAASGRVDGSAGVAGTAVYTAPSSVPAPPTVAVSVSCLSQ
jgi:hypothetical protein